MKPVIENIEEKVVNKIISGGQVGADQAALDAAMELGIPHGGWIQKGRKTQNGTLPSKYKLKEMATAGYKDRIEKNVINSDGTLIISHGRLSGSSDYTRKTALKYKRQLLHIDLTHTKILQAAKLVNSWLRLYHIKILNVSGTRTSEDPNIYKATMDLLKSAYYLSQVETKARPFDSIHQAHTGNTLSASTVDPQTVAEAVKHLIDSMPLKDRTIMANLDREGLETLNLSLGLYIIDRLIRKGLNVELLESCRAVTKDNSLSDSEAAFVIIEKLWEKLKETHRLRIVK